MYLGKDDSLAFSLLDMFYWYLICVYLCCKSCYIQKPFRWKLDLNDDNYLKQSFSSHKRCFKLYRPISRSSLNSKWIYLHMEIFYCVLVQFFRSRSPLFMSWLKILSFPLTSLQRTHSILFNRSPIEAKIRPISLVLVSWLVANGGLFFFSSFDPDGLLLALSICTACFI